MSDTRLRIRANASTGELEIEGPSQLVVDWWERLWPELSASRATASSSVLSQRRNSLITAPPDESLPELFGEFYSEFRSDVTDIDKVLIAAAFVQGKDAAKSFTTKDANQLLMDQNIKVTNASECVRRLVHAKRAFVVAGGKFRVSAIGFDHLKGLTAKKEESK